MPDFMSKLEFNLLIFSDGIILINYQQGLIFRPIHYELNPTFLQLICVFETKVLNHF